MMQVCLCVYVSVCFCVCADLVRALLDNPSILQENNLVAASQILQQQNNDNANKYVESSRER